MTLTRITAATLLSFAALAQADAATYKIDPSHTTAMYQSVHFGTSTLRGNFLEKEGTVEFDKAAKTGKVEITFQTASVNSGVPALNTHLKGKDFFDVATYPTAVFTGDKFTFDGDKVKSVAGTLTMMGKTLPLTLTATHFNCYENPMNKREVCGGDFTATIKRSAYGISYGLQYGFPDDIPMLISVEAVKQ